MKYEFKESLIKKQAQAEKDMLNELNLGDYTIQNPLIKYNAYFVNPLSAVVLFKTQEEVAITLRVLGKTSKADFYKSFAKAKVHIIPVLGLYSDYENKIELSIWQNPSSKVVHTIKVPDVFDSKKQVESIATTHEYMQDNIMMLTPAQDANTIGVDCMGDVRLYFNEQFSWDVSRVENGNIIISSEKLVRMPYFLSGLYEMSLIGKVYKEYRVPTGYHHDNFVMKDGNILALSCDYENNTVEDRCILIDRNTGGVLREYNFSDFIDIGEGKSGSWSDDDWFHCNSVWYDENTNSITLSGRHIDSMVNIDFDSGKLNWIIGDPEGWSQKMQKYFFKPIGKNFEWQYEQHANLITPLGEVMCFDNHQYGSKDSAKYKKAAEGYSRGVKYKIDTKEMTIEQTWQYGKERGSDFYSPYICNVAYYNEGHYLIHSGGIAYDAQGNPSNHLGPYTSRNGGTIKSITVEMNDDKNEYELHAHGNYYRATKLKLYSDNINLELGEGAVLGELSKTPEMDTDIPAIATGEILPEVYEGRIVEEPELFTFFGKFEKGQLVMLLVENELEVHRYFISTSAGERGAMCIGTFLGDDEREVKAIINKAGYSGEFDIRIIVDDKKFETGIKIKI